MIAWVIKLENDQGQRGYYGLGDAEGRLLVFKEVDEAVRFATEDEAEKALLQIENELGINREEAEIEMIADDRVFDLRLGGDYDDDGISVVEERGKRFIVVRNCAMEAGDEIPDEVADRLVAVLGKISKLLNQTGRA